MLELFWGHITLTGHLGTFWAPHRAEAGALSVTPQRPLASIWCQPGGGGCGITVGLGTGGGGTQGTAMGGMPGPEAAGLQSQQCPAFPRRGHTCLALLGLQHGRNAAWGPPESGDREGTAQGDAANPRLCRGSPEVLLFSLFPPKFRFGEWLGEVRSELGKGICPRAAKVARPRCPQRCQRAPMEPRELVALCLGDSKGPATLGCPQK